MKTNGHATRPLRIALFSWESMHSIAVGGLAVHVSELATALTRRGHEVHLFTRLGPAQSHYDLIEGVHYHRCPFDPNTNGFLPYVFRMCNSFVQGLLDAEKHVRAPFDIVHGHDWLSTPALVRARNELGCRSVFTVHSTEYGRCGNQLHAGISAEIRHFEWEGAYVAQQVICVSKSLRQEVLWLYGIPGEKVCAIYNGINPSKFDIDVDVSAVRRRHDIGPDHPTVLFAGRLTWQKGPDLLVEALPDILRRHPRARFIFAGDGDMRQSLEARAAALGAAAATRFVGHRSGSEMVSLFKSADAVCVPSRNEPFGIVILEAWSAGKPVVVTRNGGPAEFVQDQHTGITVAVDRESIGQGVRTLLSETDRARRMGRQGRQAAETHFSWDHIAAETEQVYMTCLEGGAADSRPSASPEETRSMAKNPDQDKPRSSSSSRRPAARAYAKKAPPMNSPGVQAQPDRPVEITEDMIRRRAHQIWLQRGGAPGDPTADWLQAERELRASARR
jgi:glycosyltransferase involved in cell wall biosynthesis